MKEEQTCVICGKQYRDTYGPGDLDEGMCLLCTTWTRRVENSPENAIVINGNLYVIGDPNDKEKGCGGAKQFYKMLSNGLLRFSDNVWHLGEVPEKFREHFPDEAKWISWEEYNAKMAS